MSRGITYSTKNVYYWKILYFKNQIYSHISWYGTLFTNNRCDQKV